MARSPPNTARPRAAPQEHASLRRTLPRHSRLSAPGGGQGAGPQAVAGRSPLRGCCGRKLRGWSSHGGAGAAEPARRAAAAGLSGRLPVAPLQSQLPGEGSRRRERFRAASVGGSRCLPPLRPSSLPRHRSLPPLSRRQRARRLGTGPAAAGTGQHGGGDRPGLRLRRPPSSLER